MDTKRLLVALAGTFAQIASARAGVNAAIVRLDSDGPSYLYSQQKLSPRDTIYFQFPKDDEPTCCRQSSGKAATPLASDPDANDYISDRKLYRYRLAVTGISVSLPFLGIAVIGSKIGVEQEASTRIIVHSGRDTTELHLCTSQEGVHLVSRSGEKTESHLYLYLGYDIDNPTCTSEQLK